MQVALSLVALRPFHAAACHPFRFVLEISNCFGMYGSLRCWMQSSGQGQRLHMYRPWNQTRPEGRPSTPPSLMPTEAGQASSLARDIKVPLGGSHGWLVHVPGAESGRQISIKARSQSHNEGQAQPLAGR